ncbi:MAG TPA: dephospho-CoA kinase [Actinomycetes bacterium]|nr:dephospho-CoA kinase [Actinomycetes bacterium]
MLSVGLTGGIGSGKSEVTRRLARRGAVVIDSDMLAREVVEPGTPGLAAVAAEFGAEVLTANGSLDRAKLAAIVFADPRRLAALNAIVHPLVRARSASLTESAAARSEAAIVVHDVPLLVEAGLAGNFDLVVVVDVPEAVQLDRLVRIRRMTEADAKARIAAQASRERRLAVADYVLDNSGDLDALDAAVDQLWSWLQMRLAAGQ